MGRMMRAQGRGAMCHEEHEEVSSFSSCNREPISAMFSVLRN